MQTQGFVVSLFRIAPFYLTIEEAPVAHNLPGKANGNGDSRKNDRDGNTLTTGRRIRVLSFQAVDSR